MTHNSAETAVGARYDPSTTGRLYDELFSAFDRVSGGREVFCCFVKRVIRRHLSAVNHRDVASSALSNSCSVSAH